MSKLGRHRRTTEQQLEAWRIRAIRGDQIREAWMGLAKIADEIAEKPTVSNPSARQKKQ